jgi:gliding motility-associated protein GldC
MRKSNIQFEVLLDEKNIPDSINWDATDNPNEGINETRAIHVAVWDNYNQGTMAIPLWTKDMEVFDMKRFYIEIMGGIADTLETATGDLHMTNQIHQLVQKLVKELKEEMKKAQQESGQK